ncbi:MAG: penicillin acylase family protein [Desulfobacterales bacterium]|nr:penicillin acylase family protein [Desulfobacterales bacterium]
MQKIRNFLWDDLRVAAIIMIAILCFGCASDDDDEDEPGNTPKPETGQFIDSPVQGMSYVSGTQSGITDSDGKFRYEKGKNIIFKIGDIVIGSEAPAKPIMTPVDLVEGATDHTNQTVTNISRFLQTLDENSNPDDGIVISGQVRNNAKGKILDFRSDEYDFKKSAQSVLEKLFDNDPPALILAEKAQAHLYRSVRSLVETTRDDKGVWFISGKEHLYSTFEAMGYAVATDRLWQAEMYRRTARGRLAEIFGESQLETDIFMRTTGYSDQELQDGFEVLDTESKTVIAAYVAGFNRRIAEIRDNSLIVPYEFSALGYLPEDWTVSDVLALLTLLLRNFDPEGSANDPVQVKNAALYQELVSKFPNDFQGMFDDLRWTDDPDALTCIPKNGKRKSATSQSSIANHQSPIVNHQSPIANRQSPISFRQAADDMTSTRRNIIENLKKINAYVKMGSYAWVISGKKTASGNPVIYSGPQMGFSAPSITLEGSIRAGGLDISGMTVAGIPGIIIGRTPHHAWSMQVGHAHTSDYYLEDPNITTPQGIEIIKCAGKDDVQLPVYRTSRGPVVYPMPYDPESYVPDPSNPIISWKYSHWGYEFKTVRAFLELARAETMDEFGDATGLVGVSQHFCYADKDNNIAYWMSGRNPVRPSGEYRLPQGFLTYPSEWDSDELVPAPADRNTTLGYYCGWNNKARTGYESGFNNLSNMFGSFHRAHVINDYLSTRDKLTFEDITNLALNIATTDSFANGGNPWQFVEDNFTEAVRDAGLNFGRQIALEVLEDWDGHFVDGGEPEWASGQDRASAWIIMDAWIREALRLTFEDELGAETYAEQDMTVLFNVFLRGFPGSLLYIANNYNWFQNLSDEEAPQTPEEIIVKALDNALTDLGEELPWGSDKRGDIYFQHELFRDTVLDPLHTTLLSSRSAYAHCVEYNSGGPVRIKSMFPLGESGNIIMGSGGTPVFDEHFYSMTELYDAFEMRAFPLFK